MDDCLAELFEFELCKCLVRPIPVFESDAAICLALLAKLISALLVFPFECFCECIINLFLKEVFKIKLFNQMVVVKRVLLNKVSTKYDCNIINNKNNL